MEMKKIKQFIIDNELDFTGIDSELNSNCVILAGFALYVMEDENNPSRLVNYLRRYCDIDLSPKAETELRRVFEFAFYNDYSEFWETDEAKEEYKF